MLLLIGAGLYIRTLVNLVKINPGFSVENLLLFQLNPGAAGLRGTAVTSFYQRMQDSLAAIPGVRSASLLQLKLLAGSMSGGGFFKLPAHPELDEKKPQAHRLAVGETFFATMGIPILLGRSFTAADTEGAPNVVIVNETFVRNYLSGDYPIGQVLRTGAWTGTPTDWQIVGVCRDAKYTGIKSDVPPTVYFCYRQDRPGSAYFALRTAVPPLSIVSAARKAVAAVDPNVPLSDITTQRAVRDKGISQETMFATLCGALAAIAVLLSCIGLYGLVSYNVARRTGEIGIRMALGAIRRHIVGPILREVFLMTAAGILVGGLGTYWATRLIQSNLYEIEPHDPSTILFAALLFLLVAALAAWIPVRRAAGVDPMTALRYE
jgi:predicted permease